MIPAARVFRITGNKPVVLHRCYFFAGMIPAPNLLPARRRRYFSGSYKPVVLVVFSLFHGDAKRHEQLRQKKKMNYVIKEVVISQGRKKLYGNYEGKWKEVQTGSTGFTGLI